MKIQYSEYVSDILILASRLRILNEQINPKTPKSFKLYGVQRGGLGVALTVSYQLTPHQLYPELDKPVVFPIYVDCLMSNFYIKEEKLTKHDIIIDDIYDTGETYMSLKSLYPETSIACLYYKITDKNIPINKNVIVSRYIYTKEYVLIPGQEF
jgi:adenine/guanine phosphoribosyltransferase-like PRPP-binding protein